MLNHKVIKIPLRVQGILTKQITRRKQICDFVDQTSSDLYHAGSIYNHASVLDVGRLIGQAGHLEQLQGKLRVFALHLVTHALLVQ